MLTPPSRTSDFSPRDEHTLVPKFCSRCLRGDDVESRVKLCETCGDPLRLRGFCPVCESFVNRAVGELCAKHDVPLEGAEAGVDRPAIASRKWITIGSYVDRSAVEGLRIRLEAEGIPTFLDGERMGSMSMYQVATGGVKLQVPEDVVDEARIIVSQLWSPLAADEEEDDLDDAWDHLAPDPWAYRRSVMKFFIIVIFFAPLIIYPSVAAISWLIKRLSF